MDLVEEEVVEEDVDDTQDRWGAPIVSSIWDGEPSSEYDHDASLDADHDDNEEIDPDQDEYDSDSIDDADDVDDDDEEDDDGSLLILWFFLKFSLLFTSCKKTNNDLCYSIDDQDPEVRMAKLNGLIGQKDTKIREL